MHRLRDDRRLFTLYFVIYLASFAVLFAFSGFPSAPKDAPKLFGDVMSAVAPAFVAITIFRRYLWHTRWLRRIMSLDIPYVAGRWEGNLLSSLQSFREPTPIVLEFWQTLDRIMVWYYDERAVTSSLVADFVSAGEGGPIQLITVYRNVPVSSQGKLVEHIGVMQLMVDPSCREINGTYFNNPRQMKSFGEIHLKFTTPKCRGRFA